MLLFVNIVCIKYYYLKFKKNILQVVFPNLDVVKLLLKCGADVNARNESKSTPLHVASIPYNYNGEVSQKHNLTIPNKYFINEIVLFLKMVRTLLDSGAHLDQPNRNNDRPLILIHINPVSVIPLMNYTSLKCLAATVITEYKIPFRNQIPKTLEEFVKLHQP